MHVISSTSTVCVCVCTRVHTHLYVCTILWYRKPGHGIMLPNYTLHKDLDERASSLPTRGPRPSSTKCRPDPSLGPAGPGCWEGSALLGHCTLFPTKGLFSKVKIHNQPTTYIKIQIAIYSKLGDRGRCFRWRNKIKLGEQSDMDTGNLTEKQFRAMIIKMIKEIGRRLDAQSKKL